MKDYLLTLDAGGTFLKAGLFERQSPVAGSFCSHPANSNGTTEEVHAAYTALLAEMRNRAEAMGGRITGVAVDIPGPFDYKNGISQMKHKYTAICGVPLRPWFAEVLGDIPVRFGGAVECNHDCSGRRTCRSSSEERIPGRQRRDRSERFPGGTGRRILQQTAGKTRNNLLSVLYRNSGWNTSGTELGCRTDQESRRDDRP